MLCRFIPDAAGSSDKTQVVSINFLRRFAYPHAHSSQIGTPSRIRVGSGNLFAQFHFRFSEVVENILIEFL